MYKNAFWLIFLLGLALSGCSLLYAPSPKIIADTPASGLRTIELTVGDSVLTVEVAETPPARAQGLSDRDSLAENTGMLFVFERADQYSFWMNRMRFGLDFLWLKDGAVVEVTANVPPPTALAPVPVSLSPAQAVNAIIEVPAGWAARYGIEVSDEVRGLP